MGSQTLAFRTSALKSMITGNRAPYDFFSALICHGLFERFPNLRIASVENGAEFLPDLFRKLRQSRDRLAVTGYYKEDPTLLFREHVWINPFWEDRIPEVIEHMGADRVIYGSDWPHMEGMESPRDILEELDGVSLPDQEKILHHNTAALNELRPA